MKLSFLTVFVLGGTACVAADGEGKQSSEQRFRRAAADVEPAEISQKRFDSFDREFQPPEGVKTFELSQDYPSEYVLDETFPWSEIDYRANASAYLQAVLKYCLEGNVEVDFRGQENAVRTWYHAPWMHDDSEKGQEGKRQGREYHHGLTRERRSRAKELHPLQVTDKIQNWAVSLYSPRGGYTLGRVWLTPDGFPDPSRATFADNTVSFKLLFSAAPLNEVPYLEGSFQWTANVNPASPPAEGTPFQRVDQTMRLLQLDVAVKDPRVASESGWIFGTFVFDGSQPGSTPWEKMVPVGLVWGDEPQEQRMLDREGSYVNPYLTEASVNASLVEPPAGTDWGKRAYLRHFGLGGRLNGPVDNPYSSCISCHGRAGTFAAALPLSPKSGDPMPFLAGTGAALGSKAEQIASFQEFFRPIRPNSHLEGAKAPGGETELFVTVDYSLQLSQGIRNFYQALRLKDERLQQLKPAQESGGDHESEFIQNADELPKLQRVSRDEGEQ